MGAEVDPRSDVEVEELDAAAEGHPCATILGHRNFNTAQCQSLFIHVVSLYRFVPSGPGMMQRVYEGTRG